MVASVRRLLIIFYRNPELSKVKTRLASAIGDGYALAIYLKLAEHTRSVCSALDINKIIYYSEYVDHEDAWSDSIFTKALQQGSDLGERMSRAFQDGFSNGYGQICIIGTDCIEISTTEIKNAFNALSDHDVVIGPAVDGGYYLLGMKKLHDMLFKDKHWSTSTVLTETRATCKMLGVTLAELPTLRDVDTVDDLPPHWIPKDLR
jgi:uncharacterized protein